MKKSYIRCIEHHERDDDPVHHRRGGRHVFKQVRDPVITVNGDLWPINYEANRRHMLSFDAIVLKDADHFLMMARPEEFNRELEKAIQMLLEKYVEQ